MSCFARVVQCCTNRTLTCGLTCGSRSRFNLCLAKNLHIIYTPSMLAHEWSSPPSSLSYSSSTSFNLSGRPFWLKRAGVWFKGYPRCVATQFCLCRRCPMLRALVDLLYAGGEDISVPSGATRSWSRWPRTLRSTTQRRDRRYCMSTLVRTQRKKVLTALCLETSRPYLFSPTMRLLL